MASPWSEPAAEAILRLALELMTSGDTRGRPLLTYVLGHECGAPFAATVVRALEAGTPPSSFAFLAAAAAGSSPTRRTRRGRRGRLRTVPTGGGEPTAPGRSGAADGAAADRDSGGPLAGDAVHAIAAIASAIAGTRESAPALRPRGPMGEAPPPAAGASRSRRGPLPAPPTPAPPTVPPGADGAADDRLPPASPAGAGYLTVREVADRFAVSSQSVYRWLAAGRIRAERRPGGTYRIPAAQFGETPG